MVIDSIQEFDLPVEVIALTDKINFFKNAIRSSKTKTEWFDLCANSPAFLNWNKRNLLGAKLNDIQFTTFVAGCYAELLELKSIPYCAPAKVRKASEHAAKLFEFLPHSSLLPREANEPLFLKGLSAISALNAEQIPPYAITAKGNPVVRWMICKLVDEFCYSFAKAPTIGIIGDMIRLGWPLIDDRSIRNTATDSLIENSLHKAEIRRQNDNQAKLLAQREENAHSIAEAALKSIAATSQNQPINLVLTQSATIAKSDDARLNEMENLAKGLSDSSERRRIISIINAIRYDHGYQQED